MVGGYALALRMLGGGRRIWIYHDQIDVAPSCCLHKLADIPMGVENYTMNMTSILCDMLATTQTFSRTAEELTTLLSEVEF